MGNQKVVTVNYLCSYMKNIRFSVVIPLFNQGEFLHDAVDSLFRQSYPNWQAIIVNDGSTDNSAEIAENYAKRDSRIQVVHRVNGGLSAARNTGLQYASGDCVALLDSDDYYLPTLLEAVNRTFENNRDASVVWCKPQETNEKLKPIKPYQRSKPSLSTKLSAALLSSVPAYRLVWDNPLIPCGQVWKRDRILPLGFDESLRSNEDWDIVSRLERAGGRFAFLPGVHSLYRRHGSSLNTNFRRMIQTRIMCGVKNYANCSDDFVARLSRLALTLGTSALSDDDELIQLIPGSHEEDVETILSMLESKQLAPFGILWCGGAVRRIGSSAPIRCYQTVKFLKKMLFRNPLTWKLSILRATEIVRKQ
jgi:glycosyltransferase involved in cell wall biosynthesis